MLVCRFADLTRVNVGILSHQLVVQAMDVVGIVDAERRLNDGKLDDKLDAG